MSHFLNLLTISYCVIWNSIHDSVRYGVSWFLVGWHMLIWLDPVEKGMTDTGYCNYFPNSCTNLANAVHSRPKSNTTWGVNINKSYLYPVQIKDALKRVFQSLVCACHSLRRSWKNSVHSKNQLANLSHEGLSVRWRQKDHIYPKWLELLS